MTISSTEIKNIASLLLDKLYDIALSYESTGKKTLDTNIRDNTLEYRLEQLSIALSSDGRNANQSRGEIWWNQVNIRDHADAYLLLAHLCITETERNEKLVEVVKDTQAELENSTADYKSDVAVSEKEISELQDKVKELKSDKKDLEKEHKDALRDLQDKFDEMESDRDRLDRQVNKLEAEVSALEDQVSQLEGNQKCSTCEN